MFDYALLNDQDICIGISRLTGSVESADLIPLLEYDEDYLWRKYDRDTGEWSSEKYEPVQPQPPEDEITQLKIAMAELAEAYEQTVTDLQLALAELAELIAGGDT